MGWQSRWASFLLPDHIAQCQALNVEPSFHDVVLSTALLCGIHQVLTLHIQVLTGDTLLGAKQVWDSIGMPSTDGIEGHSLAAMEADQFLAAVRRFSIFAKVTPQQKVQIVTMLQKNDHIVGFLGDGTNDALALRQADVGVSVDSGALWAAMPTYFHNRNMVSDLEFTGIGFIFVVQVFYGYALMIDQATLSGP